LFSCVQSQKKVNRPKDKSTDPRSSHSVPSIILNMKRSSFNKDLRDHDGKKQKIQGLMDDDIKETKRDLKRKKELLEDVGNARKKWMILGDSLTNL